MVNSITSNISRCFDKKVTNSCYWILIPHYNWMSGIWKSDSSQKNKGKALTGWKIAEFACFFVSDLLLFTACKPQLSIEWQVSKVANIFWHIVTAPEAIWFYYAFSPFFYISFRKKFCILEMTSRSNANHLCVCTVEHNSCQSRELHNFIVVFPFWCLSIHYH